MNKFNQLVPETEERTNIFKGVVFNKKPFIFYSSSNNNKTLTNIYEIELDQNIITTKVASELKYRYLNKYLKKYNQAALINAGFSYNTDTKTFLPKNFNYHLQIRNGKLLSLPTKTKTAIIEINGKIETKLIPAKGSLWFNGVRLDWVGSHDYQNKLLKNKGVVWGLSNIKLFKYNNRITINKKSLVIPEIKGHKNIVIDIDNKDVLFIKTITSKNVNLLHGVFIISISNELSASFKKGQKLTRWKIYGLNSTEKINVITSGISMDKNLSRMYKKMKQEKIFITFDGHSKKYYYNKIDEQKARSCIFETNDKKLHFLLVDARPNTTDQKGMTMADLSEYIYSNYDINWAVNCDGGQSSKICIKNKNKIQTFGNLHYYKIKNGKIIKWDGINGRPIGSCLIATIKK